MKPKRRILLWTLCGAVLTLVYFVFLDDVVRSLAWHLVHGNTVTYQGHSMTLPLLWRQNHSNSGALELSRAAFFHPFVDAGLSGPESLIILSEANSPAQLDKAGAERWQSLMVTSFQAGGNFAKSEDLQSRSMTFYCFNRDDGSTHRGCLACKATGMNWEIVFGVGDGGAGPVQEQLQEARAILRSIQ